MSATTEQSCPAGRVGITAALGREIFPVNPRPANEDGQPCSGSVGAIGAKVGVVDLVTPPPPVTEVILRECLEKGITRAWLQPGVESQAAIAFCRENGIRVVHGICVMLV